MKTCIIGLQSNYRYRIPNRSTVNLWPQSPMILKNQKLAEVKLLCQHSDRRIFNLLQPNLIKIPSTYQATL
jgi:hypothetical protein